MHVYLFVEEPSAEAALNTLIPRIVGQEHTFQVLTFPGKQALLKRLPSRLPGYRWVADSDECKLAVVLDRDHDDCRTLKRRLETMVRRAGLTTKRRSKKVDPFDVVIRIVVPHLEAWILGDVPALCAAYPKISPHLATRPRLRDPDAVGDVWRVLERELQRHGYFGSGLAKIEFARTVAHHMNPERNRSASFRCFRDGLRALVGQ